MRCKIPIMIVRASVISLTLVFLCGCSHEVTVSDGQGSQVTVDKTSGNMTVTDANGAKGSVTNSTGTTNYTATDKNGDTTTMTSEKDGSVKVQGKDGNTSIGGGTSITEAELEVPFYPGSTEKPASNMKHEGNDEKVYSTTRETTDSPEQVAEFYKGKIKGMNVITGPDAASGGGALPSGAAFAFAATKQDGKTQITLTTTAKVKK